MITLSVGLQKGGVGKSTVTLGIGSYFHELGKRTLFIDADSQHNISSVFNVDVDNTPTLYEVLRNEVSIQDAIITTEFGDILPGKMSLGNRDIWSGKEAEFRNVDLRFCLKKALDTIKDRYDLVIIDTPPNIGFLLLNALVASNGVIVPLVPEVFAQDALADFVETFDAVKKQDVNPSLRLLGIVLNRYDNRLALHRITKKELEDAAEKLGTKVFSTTIRQNVTLSEAQRMLCPSIYKYNLRSNGSKDFAAVCQELEESLWKKT